MYFVVVHFLVDFWFNISPSNCFVFTNTTIKRFESDDKQRNPPKKHITTIYTRNNSEHPHSNKKPCDWAVNQLNIPEWIFAESQCSLRRDREEYPHLFIIAFEFFRSQKKITTRRTLHFTISILIFWGEGEGYHNLYLPSITIKYASFFRFWMTTSHVQWTTASKNSVSFFWASSNTRRYLYFFYFKNLFLFLVLRWIWGKQSGPVGIDINIKRLSHDFKVRTDLVQPTVQFLGSKV